MHENLSTELAVEWIPTAKLSLNPSNPRINDAAVEPVAASIRRFGWRQPIVARPDGVVPAGNTRYFRPRHGSGALETVWEVEWEGKSRVVGNEHPTQKPLRLFEIPMEVHTSPGDLLAAERLHRRCHAVDVEPAFVDVAIRRWEKAMGKSATLEASGQTFAEVAAERISP